MLDHDWIFCAFFFTMDLCFRAAIPWQYAWYVSNAMVNEPCSEDACVVACVRAGRGIDGPLPLDHVHYVSVVAPLVLLHRYSRFKHISDTVPYDVACADRVWFDAVVGVMRDRGVWRTVRAAACYTILFDLARHHGLVLMQEAADTAVALYAGLQMPAPLLALLVSVTDGCDGRLVTAGGVDIARLSARQRGTVTEGQLWDCVAHRTAPCESWLRLYSVGADVFLGTFLLGLCRLEARGVIAVAHAAMLEDMMELVPLLDMQQPD